MKQAGVMLIVNQGMLLAISRRHDKTIFGLPGGKFDADEGDQDTKDTAIRETREETGVNVKECQFVYERVELGDGPNGVDFYSRCYYATSWEGTPTNSEEGDVKWLTAEEITSSKAAFGDYNRKMLDQFKTLFPNVYLKGESYMRQFVGGALPPPGREWEIGKTVDEIKALHKVIGNTKFWVVSDANGECKGIFATEDLANKVADFYGAYVSDQVVQSVLPSEMNKGE